MFIPSATAVLIALSTLTAARVMASSEQEVVAVTAQQTLSETSAPFANSATIVLPESSPGPPRALAELLRQQAGVAYNGQGGLFQTFAIRGLGRQRLGSFYLDIPLFSERRAGTAASFVDPSMIEAVELVRGPASILHGFGSIAGILRIHPREYRGLGAGLGFGSAGDENLQYVGHGGEQLQLALSHRGANDSTTSAGHALNSGFDQYNLSLAAEKEYRDVQFSVDSLFSYADDVGKSNRLFPTQRISDYPRERHWLGQLAAERPGAWRGSIFLHLQDLETRVERPDQRLNEVDNSSADYGGKLVLFRGSRKTPLRMGVDYLARRDVDADEKQSDFATGQRTHRDILRAEQDELALFADLEHGYRSLQWAAGLRMAHSWQDAQGYSDDSEAYASGFAGVEWFTSDTLSLNLQVSAGQRPANLSERFFNGTTGRGSVVGNPALETEKSVSIDLGSRWETDAGNLTVHGFYTRLDDLIERVEVSPDTLSYRNNRHGDIYGAELNAQRRFAQYWLVSASGHFQASEDDDGDTLQDTAPDRVSLGLDYQKSRWQLRALYEYRFSKSDVASTELPVDSARLLSARFEFALNRQLTVALWGRNLLDDRYTLSTDELSTEGEERAVGFNLLWQSQ